MGPSRGFAFAVPSGNCRQGVRQPRIGPAAVPGHDDGAAVARVHESLAAARRGKEPERTRVLVPRRSMALPGRCKGLVPGLAAPPCPKNDAKHRDHCGGTRSPGGWMVTSMGLACDTDCYDAMSDFRGRHPKRYH